MTTYRVSVYYCTSAYIEVQATSAEAARDAVEEMDWRDDSFTVAEGSAEIEDIEELSL